jgi:ribosome-binding factor A
VSRRTERIGSLIRTTLAGAIQSRLSDPRIEPLTSITRVDVSADFSVAHVYVSVMAEESRRRLSVQALQHAAGRLRTLIAQQLTLRQAPALDFRLDDSVRRSFETVQQLDRIMAELDTQPGSGGETVAQEPGAGDGAQEPADSESPAVDEPEPEPGRWRGGGVDEVREGQEDT